MKKQLLERAVELRHELHRYPELSNHEYETKKRLIRFIGENSELEICDRGAWFYAAYRTGKPNKKIAFRADFDAIKVMEDDTLEYASVNKGVAHKCGHDGHAAALAAFACDVWETGADCDVFFIFQHAEETGDGALVCAKVIDEEQIDEIYAVHNFPGHEFGSFNIRKGTICCASKGIEIVFKGVSAHASQPENGRNPAQAISTTVMELEKISDQSLYEGLVLATVVQIDVGERAFGVAAHDGKLLMTIRGQHEDEMVRMEKQIEQFARMQADKYGLEISFCYYDVFPETYNDEKAVEKLERIAGTNGWTVNEMKEPIRSSEDFGWFLKRTPGALIWLGAGEECDAIHTEGFDYNDNLIERTTQIFWELIKKMNT